MSRLTLGLTSPDYFFSDLQDALKRAVDDNSEKLYVTNEGGNIFLLNDPLFELPTAEQCPAVLIDCDEGEAVIDAEEYARKGNRRHELCYDFKNRRRSFQLKPQFHGQRVYLPDAYVYQWLNEEGMTVR
jgi:hypothetical protein